MNTSRSPARIACFGAVLLCARMGMVSASAADATMPASSASASSALDAAGTGDGSPEREALAALTRELDLLDRLAEHAATTAPQGRTRYHFDYDRLREDVQRVRTGVQDYLVPQRAQPRDPLPISGNYTRNRPADGKETP
jgi:RAQPRD family integrative conjugative element protein